MEHWSWCNIFRFFRSRRFLCKEQAPGSQGKLGLFLVAFLGLRVFLRSRAVDDQRAGGPLSCTLFKWDNLQSWLVVVDRVGLGTLAAVYIVLLWLWKLGWQTQYFANLQSYRRGPWYILRKSFYMLNLQELINTFYWRFAMFCRTVVL